MGDTINILVVGAGAVGAFYASRLQHHLFPPHSPNKTSISLVCRSNYSAVLNSGFTLKTRPFGDYTFRPDGVFRTCDDAANSGVRWDYILVATKSLVQLSADGTNPRPASMAAADLIAPAVTPAHTAVVLIQNGVGIETPYRQRFPANPILSAVTVIAAAQTEPGVVVHHRWMRIAIGPYTDSVDGSESHDSTGRDTLSATRTSSLVDLFKLGGVTDAEQHTSRNIQIVRWHKLGLNAAFNPSSVLAGSRPTYELLVDADAREHCEAVMAEVFHAAKIIFKLDAFPPQSHPESAFPTLSPSATREYPKLATIHEIIESSLRNKTFKSSMVLDWESQREMEVEVILGNAVKIAKRFAVQGMGRVQGMYALLKLAEKARVENAGDARKEKSSL
ncbi:ketopantoate reductase PanE/ApbA-domain-containing protein [Fimicolochytrium jonesii]|uniref:ketopantoate reductase PanE/ApbA-domain-containing protein n=1 Tax=Fimicolochytrium jonesii TaxID=1396493 RepID=UPI0022FEE486|nr:ketopantoate reductase PanE/ApbA-domain-containing protein [Fimicolochytrium jonesii]KAI8819364.1 ketopantoate reductase PanE/ApbA-domain-containing protein [Fimicolochytrium jonesii]